MSIVDAVLCERRFAEQTSVVREQYIAHNVATTYSFGR